MLDRPVTMADLVVWGILVVGISVCLSVLVAEVIDTWQERSGRTMESLQRNAVSQWRNRRRKQ